MKRVSDFIKAHLSEPLPIGCLATTAILRRAHFSKVSTASLAVSPSDCVTARRPERIERPLLATGMTVADIARTTGFAAPNSLGTAVRGHRGNDPLAVSRDAGRGGLTGAMPSSDWQYAAACGD